MALEQYYRHKPQAGSEMRGGRRLTVPEATKRAGVSHRLIGSVLRDFGVKSKNFNGRRVVDEADAN